MADIQVPFIVFNLKSFVDTFAIDSCLEHLDNDDPINVQFMYKVQGEWYCDQLASITWPYARKKVVELFDFVETTILCTVFMGEIHDQTIGNVDDLFDA